jgi:hypothetical protein
VKTPGRINGMLWRIGDFAKAAADKHLQHLAAHLSERQLMSTGRSCADDETEYE